MSSRRKEENLDLFLECKTNIHKRLLSFENVKELNSVLYLINQEMINYIKDYDSKLRLEYGDEKKFSISHIVKVINFDKPSHWFNTFTAYDWKQINDKDKVLKALEGEFEKTFNKLKVDVKRKIKAKDISEENENKILQDINKEYSLAQKELKFIKDNFNDLDVRISSYKVRKKYAKIDYKINKVRQVFKNLKSTVPNALWFEELSDDEKANENNELIRYFKHAKNPFGFVYYALKSDYNKDEK